MEPHPSPLSDQPNKGLRNPAQARLETCALLPAALQALIAAILSRLFDRLEQLFLAWRSGTLPAPKTRNASPPRATARATHRTTTPRRTTRRARTRVPDATTTSAPRQTPELPPSNTIKPPSRPRQCPLRARAPPPETQKKSRFRSPRHDLIVTIKE